MHSIRLTFSFNLMLPRISILFFSLIGVAWPSFAYAAEALIYSAKISCSQTYLITALAPTQDQHLKILKRPSLEAYEADRVEITKLSSFLSPRHFQNMLFEQSGNKVLGLDSEGRLWFIDLSRKYERQVGIKSKVIAICQNREKTKWYALADKGRGVYDIGMSSSFKKRKGQPPHRLTRIQVAPDGQLIGIYNWQAYELESRPFRVMLTLEPHKDKLIDWMYIDKEKKQAIAVIEPDNMRSRKYEVRRYYLPKNGKWEIVDRKLVYINIWRYKQIDYLNPNHIRVQYSLLYPYNLKEPYHNFRDQLCQAVSSDGKIFLSKRGIHRTSDMRRLGRLPSFDHPGKEARRREQSAHTIGYAHFNTNHDLTYFNVEKNLFERYKITSSTVKGSEKDEALLDTSKKESTQSMVKQKRLVIQPKSFEVQVPKLLHSLDY